MTSTTQAATFDSAWWGQFNLKRIGYHRKSDDSITSAWLNTEEMADRLSEVLADPDITRVWTVQEYGTADFEFVREADNWFAPEWAITHPDFGRYSFVWEDSRESVHCRTTGEAFGPIDCFRDRRWSSVRQAVAWTLAEIENIARIVRN